MSEEKIIPVGIIESKIFIIRDKKVILDRDLAQLYGVETRALNFNGPFSGDFLYE